MANDDFVTRTTGCPNGCARPYMAEIAFVGSGPNAYQLWLGGSPDQVTLTLTLTLTPTPTPTPTPTLTPTLTLTLTLTLALTPTSPGALASRRRSSR